MNLKFKRCIFLEYTNRVNGYHLWDLTAQKIVNSIDVIFIENQLQKKNEDDNIVKQKYLVREYGDKNSKQSRRKRFRFFQSSIKA